MSCRLGVTKDERTTYFRGQQYIGDFSGVYKDIIITWYNWFMRKCLNYFMLGYPNITHLNTEHTNVLVFEKILKMYNFPLKLIHKTVLIKKISCIIKIF